MNMALILNEKEGGQQKNNVLKEEEKKIRKSKYKERKTLKNIN